MKTVLPIRPEVIAWCAAQSPRAYALAECLEHSRRTLQPCGLTEAEFKSFERRSPVLLLRRPKEAEAEE